MCSYVYMKILESQPRRYDWGIAWLSFGQSDRIRRRLARQLVSAGSRVLDIGCGTGTLAVLAAQKGAHVVGFDTSPGMLRVARNKVTSAGLWGNVQLHEMGVAGMDRFPEAAFDLVTATLVFSELSPDERAYVVAQAFRVLKPGGRLAVADEVRPGSFCKRLIYGTLHVPVLLVTFALTQTATRPVDGLEDLVSAAGFTVQRAERNRLENFLYLVAVKEQA